MGEKNDIPDGGAVLEKEEQVDRDHDEADGQADEAEEFGGAGGEPIAAGAEDLVLGLVERAAGAGLPEEVEGFRFGGGIGGFRQGLAVFAGFGEQPADRVSRVFLAELVE